MKTYVRTVHMMLLVAIALLVPARFLTAQPAAVSAMIVSFDMGGSIQSRQTEVRKLRRTGQRVEIIGRCYSACTMYLGLSNVCVAPNAVLGFHGPKGVAGSLASDVFDHWSQVMARNMRKPLQVWFMQHARHVRSGVLKVSGSTLINMGYARCQITS
ncbi:hypothetical protein OO012_19085 [Rhodobacteraceae bacterium KMM 6894]|nr:hypothetical protein [Rhodobacteraceae bacterium KMM 6894]